MSDTLRPMVKVVSDGFVVTSNTGTAEELEANLKAEAAPKDGDPEDPKETETKETAAAAARLGKKGGAAAAKARAKAAKEGDDGKEGKEAPDAGDVRDHQRVQGGPGKVEGGEPDPGQATPDRETPGNPRHDLKARISQLTQARNEERQKREEFEARLAELEAERTAPKSEAKPEQKGAARPNVDDYESYEDWVEALADWKADERLKKSRQEDDERAKVERAVEAVKKRGEAFRERVHAATEVQERLKAPEAGELMKELAPSWSVPPGTPLRAVNAISDAIIDSEQAPQLLVYLAENPDEMDQLRGLPDPGAVMRAIGRLEARLGKEAEEPEPVRKPVPVVSSARPPVRPISGSPASVEDDVDAEDDFDAYKRKADARDAKLRRVR